MTKAETDAAWFALEKRVMTGDILARPLLVSAFRTYRQAVDAALASRWGDGTIDSVNAGTLASEVAECAEVHAR